MYEVRTKILDFRQKWVYDLFDFVKDAIQKYKSKTNLDSKYFFNVAPKFTIFSVFVFKLSLGDKAELNRQHSNLGSNEFGRGFSHNSDFNVKIKLQYKIQF